VTFSFDNPNVDILFSDDLDRLNFRELPAGTVMGTVTSDQQGVVTVTDETGIEVTQNYFKIVEGRLTFTRPIMPSMLTLDERVIRQDCLCYLMERLSAGAVSPSPPL
jgi:hypothetical protein